MRLRVVRVAIEIPRPVPIARLRLETSVRRSGRSVTAIVGQLFDQDGKLVMNAEALALSRAEIGIPAPRPQMDELLPSESSPIEFPFHDSKPGYAAGMELRFARGTFGKGDVMAWMRMRLPLLSDADLSPLERTLIAADSGNGVSQRVSPFEYTFLNADLTVTLHHPAEGEWIGMAARTDFDIDGVGVADTRLYDARWPDRPRHPDPTDPQALAFGFRLILTGGLRLGFVRRHGVAVAPRPMRHRGVRAEEV